MVTHLASERRHVGYFWLHIDRESSTFTRYDQGHRDNYKHHTIHPERICLLIHLVFCVYCDYSELHVEKTRLNKSWPCSWMSSNEDEWWQPIVLFIYRNNLYHVRKYRCKNKYCTCNDESSVHVWGFIKSFRR